MKLTPLERLHKVGWVIDPVTYCWIINGYKTPSGYGFIGGLHTSRPHRIAYEEWVGPIPPGYVIRHKCDNPPCVNPNHLIPGTDADNIADRDRRNRTSKGQRHYESRFSEQDVIEIRESTDSYSILAQRHQVSKQAIYKIKKHKSYK